MQACEKLWGAATHAVMAVALERDWAIESHRDLKNAVQRLSAETDADIFWGGFIAAEKYHKVYSAEEIEVDRPFVHRFVHRTLALLQHGAG